MRISPITAKTIPMIFKNVYSGSNTVPRIVIRTAIKITTSPDMIPKYLGFIDYLLL